MLGIKLHTISSSILYLVLIFVFIKSWMTMMNEQTAFEENHVENERKLPSFTLCPLDNNSIESFEDVASAIKNVESKFSIEYFDFNRDFQLPIPMLEKYNNSSDSDWYFVPKISIRSPSEDAICMIWTPSKERRPKWNTFVCTYYFIIKLL